MGSGDLNLLKSWNPHLLKNKKKVWETEQQLLDEHRKIKERQLEIAKERELEELSSLTRDGTNSNKKKKKTGLEWMYEDAAAALQEKNDDFLLGRRKVDQATLERRQEALGNEKKHGPGSSRAGIEGLVKGADAVPAADLSKEDPMYKFKLAKLKRAQELGSKSLYRKQEHGKVLKKSHENDARPTTSRYDPNMRHSSGPSLQKFPRKPSGHGRSSSRAQEKYDGIDY